MHIVEPQAIVFDRDEKVCKLGIAVDLEGKTPGEVCQIGRASCRERV